MRGIVSSSGSLRSTDEHAAKASAAADTSNVRVNMASPWIGTHGESAFPNRFCHSALPDRQRGCYHLRQRRRPEVHAPCRHRRTAPLRAETATTPCIPVQWTPKAACGNSLSEAEFPCQGGAQVGAFKLKEMCRIGNADIVQAELPGQVTVDGCRRLHARHVRV